MYPFYFSLWRLSNTKNKRGNYRENRYLVLHLLKRWNENLSKFPSHDRRQFTSYSGSSTSTTRLMRLNTNGTQDLTYNTGTGLNSYPLTILPTADGKVLVLGLFTV